MSRVGKKPVPVPSGVTANVSGTTINVKGPKGALSLVFDERVSVEMDKGEIKVDPKDESKAARALWGTTRANLNNIMTGVTKGFERKLEITGVGYRAAVQGKNLQLALGYSHDVLYPIPDGIAVVTPKPTEIVVTGIDKKKVGQVAAEIRAYRPPEPTRARACDTPANSSSVRKARRSNDQGRFKWHTNLLQNAASHACAEPSRQRRTAACG